MERDNIDIKELFLYILAIVKFELKFYKDIFNNSILDLCNK